MKFECPSFRGLLNVAEAEKGTDVTPHALEVVEVEVEATTRVGAHVRHPVVAVSLHRSNVRKTIYLTTSSTSQTLYFIWSL